MKTLLVFLFLVASVALAVGSPMDPASHICCINFLENPIPLRYLKSFEYTGQQCGRSAIVFVTKRGINICADPSEQWVQDRIRDLSQP